MAQVFSRFPDRPLDGTSIEKSRERSSYAYNSLAVFYVLFAGIHLKVSEHPE